MNTISPYFNYSNVNTPKTFSKQNAVSTVINPPIIKPLECDTLSLIGDRQP